MGDFVAAIVVIIIFGAPVAAWITHRVLAHQERMEMIRNGYIPPVGKGAVPPPMGGYPPQYGSAPQAPFRGGYAGPVPPPPYFDEQFQAQQQLRRGVTVAMIGFAITLGLSFIRGPLHPGPWLIGGLVPLFVGVAQVINALLNGARLPAGATAPEQGQYAAPTGPRPAPNPPGQGPTGPMPPPPTPGTYGAWRPDGTPEIPKPASPPDKV